MAYTNSPQFNTYKTVDVQFNVLDQMRDGSNSTRADARLINMYYDRIKGADKGGLVRVVKRDGIGQGNFSLTKNSSSDVLRGYHYNIDNLALYWAVNNKVYMCVPSASPSVRTVATLNTSSGAVGFCSYFRSDGVHFVAISDGTDCWLDAWATTTCTRITDVDMPTPHVPTPVYLDGYLLLAKADTQDIYNSDPDDPFSWSIDNFVQAEINSDSVLRLTKVRNYLVALGTESIEFFWDAGIATGSPFSRNDSAVSPVGYVSGGILIGDEYYFIGKDKKNNLGVFKLAGFKCERISTAPVDRLLQPYTFTSSLLAGRPSLNIDGYCLNTNGHTFYIVKTSLSTWVYDTVENFWYEWTNSSNAALGIEATWTAYNGESYLAIAGQSSVSIMSPSLYQDFGSNYTTTFVTGNYWFETFNWKICHKITLMANQPVAGTANVALSWTDDDGLNFTTARNVNIGAASPYLTRCGKFRRRSCKIEFTANYPLLLEGMKFDLNVYGI